jgi:transcriptional regulator with XRE-family HTH domain
MDDDQSVDSLGGFIRAQRTRKGLSFRQLAEKAGVNSAYILRIEQGERKSPSAKVIQDIADALELEAYELLRYIGVRSSLPEPVNYFRRKLGVNAEQADILARLVKDYQEKTEENHEDTYKGGDEHVR